MTDNYNDILDNNVKDAKNEIRDLEDPDYEKLLELEAQGDNRKTLRQWLEKRLEQEEYEMGKEDAVDEMFLSSISPASALVGGLIIGLVIGLAGAAYGPIASGGASASPAQVEQSVTQLFSASGSTPDSVDVTRQNGMYTVNVTSARGNQSATQTFFVSPDGQLLFRSSGPLGQPTYFNIDELSRRLAQQPANETAG